MEHRIPIGALHAHHKLVARDPGVVYQDIDLAEMRERRLEDGLDLFFVTDIKNESRRVATRRSDLDDEFFEVLLISCRDGHSGTRPRQLESAGAADTLRSTRNQRHASGESHARHLRVRTRIIPSGNGRAREWDWSHNERNSEAVAVR